MNKQTILAYILLLGAGFLTSGCITIEQEIFLQPDGSGELVLHFSLPDLPEEAKSAPVGKDNPENILEKMKKEVVEKLPPTITLKEAKEVKQNGTQGFYAVFQFKNVKDVESIMQTVFKETTKDTPGSRKMPSEWVIRLDKQAGGTTLTQRFFTDVSENKSDKAEKPAEAKPEPEPEAAQARPAGRRTAKTGRKGTRAAKAAAAAPVVDPVSGPSDPMSGIFAPDMDKKIEQMILSIIKFRFVIHTPAPVSGSNADIVLRGNTALWECSLGAFAKEKKPIEMKVSY